MLTLIIHSKDCMERVVKSLEGFNSYELNDREDGTYEIYLGVENQNDVVADLED